jgi:hypothetical protein
VSAQFRHESPYLLPVDASKLSPGLMATLLYTHCLVTGECPNNRYLSI